MCLTCLRLSACLPAFFVSSGSTVGFLFLIGFGTEDTVPSIRVCFVITCLPWR
nr:MAG TPA: hypothetical protein [Caudoviricetes sp.]